MKLKSRLKGFAALAVAGFVGLSAPVAAQQGGMIRVDLELVLAVDISQSMDYDEHSIQRQGYVDAFPDDRGPVVFGGASLGFGVQVGL